LVLGLPRLLSGGVFARTLEGFERHGAAAEVKAAFADARSTLTAGLPPNGLTQKENETLAASEDLVTINRLIKRGREAIFPDGSA
jgi:hypothetical protein